MLVRASPLLGGAFKSKTGRLHRTARGATLRAVIELQPPATVDWTQPLPGSKSLTNRALLLAALAEGRSRLTGCLDADDPRLMRAALATLGLQVGPEDECRTLTVLGAAGPFTQPDAAAVEIFVGTAGTVARFLLSVLAASPVIVKMDGTPRMRERPMELLVDALRGQGASIEDLGAPGHLPLTVRGGSLPGGVVRIPRPASSQFVSGLVLAAALAQAPTRIVLEQGTPARPYVDMTLATLRAFGGHADWDDDAIVVTPTPLKGRDYAIEPDASAASYPLTLAAIHGGRTQIDDLGTASLQGDVGFAKILQRMGAKVDQTPTQTTVVGTGHLRAGAFDLTDMPDMTLTLAVAALFADGPTEISGVAILRHHESDRLAAAATELRKLGADVTEREDGLRIVPPPAGPRRGVEIDTYDDHRMAMAFSLAGHVRIRDPACVAKTYPDYFNHLDKLGMVVTAG